MRAEAWSEADFLALVDDRRLELVDGMLVVSPDPTLRHQRIAFAVALALEAARAGDTEVFPGGNVRVGPQRILIPDVLVVRRRGLDDLVCDAADVALVVEVASPGTVAVDRSVKARLYAEAGIATYVRIEESGPSAMVGRLLDGVYVFHGPDRVLNLDDPFPVSIDLRTLATR